MTINLAQIIKTKRKNVTGSIKGNAQPAWAVISITGVWNVANLVIELTFVGGNHKTATTTVVRIIAARNQTQVALSLINYLDAMCAVE